MPHTCIYRLFIRNDPTWRKHNGRRRGSSGMQRYNIQRIRAGEGAAHPLGCVATLGALGEPAKAACDISSQLARIEQPPEFSHKFTHDPKHKDRNAMPRISEANLEEHRRNTMNALLDCAEHIVKTQGNDALTPAAVSQGAGIARNSIYRYVDNMDDLRHKLLQRHLPDWRKALENGLAGVSDPVETIAIWVRINLEQTSIHGHGWMMKLHPTSSAAARKPKPDTKPDVNHDGSDDKPDFHATIAMPVARAWRQLCPHSPCVGATITRGLVSSGMRLLESAHDDDQARAIIAQVEQAARAVAQSMREDGGESGSKGGRGVNRNER